MFCRTLHPTTATAGLVYETISVHIKSNQKIATQSQHVFKFLRKSKFQTFLAKIDASYFVKKGKFSPKFFQTLSREGVEIAFDINLKIFSLKCEPHQERN